MLLPPNSLAQPTNPLAPNVRVWGGWHPVPADLTNAVALAGGSVGEHNLALWANGTVTAWGLNDYGQCDVPLDLTNAVALAGGASFSLALRDDGTVVGWGRNQFGQCDPLLDCAT
jgi:alpha-tubulin suppressor-like RCC1 family protein